jgi:hypothetical protein
VSKTRIVTARIKRLAPKRRRVFGALRNVVRVDPSFFDPLPIAELDAWEGGSKRTRAPTTQKRLAVALEAFWLIAEDWGLSTDEQCALLAVSRTTLARWKANAPSSKKTAYRTIDRLLLILRTYVWFSEVAAHGMEHGMEWDAEVRNWYLRLPGGAGNAEVPTQSILEMLSDRSVLTMLDHYHRLAQRRPPKSRSPRHPRRTKSSSRA